MGTLRRAKDITTRNNKNVAKMVLQDYPDWQQQAPVYITYYQVNDPASYQDYNLETTHSLVGGSSSLKYNKIFDVPLYGVDALDISNEVGERGYDSLVSGNGFFLPETIEPRSGEFFVFDIEGLEDHLFQITDVQMSHATAYKYYQIQYKLYPENVDGIFNNVSEDYTLIYDNLNSGATGATTAGTASGIVKKTSALQADSAKLLVDQMIKDYVKDYFDDEVNYFIYRTEIDNQPAYLWCGYLNHFLCKNHVINYYNKTIMSDIYLLDIDNWENANAKIYKELIYRKSLFKAVENQNNCCTFDTSFLQVTSDVLRTRNLPFFASNGPYKLMDIGNRNPGESVNMWSLLTGDEFHSFGKDDEWHRLTPERYNILLTDDSLITNDEDMRIKTELERNIKIGDSIYILGSGSPTELEYPKEAYYIYPSTGKLPDNNATTEEDGTLIQIDLNYALSYSNTDTWYEQDLLFRIIKEWVNDKFTLTADLLTELNNYYYEINARNYILIPLVIYILQQKITDLLK